MLHQLEKKNYSGWNKAGPKALPIQPTVTASRPICGPFLKGTVRKPPTRYYSNCTNNNIKIMIAINKQNHWLADSYLTTMEWIKTFAHWLLYEKAQRRYFRCVNLYIVQKSMKVESHTYHPLVHMLIILINHLI